MEFRVLGPLEVLDGQRVITFEAAKQRALLGVLLLHANEVVSRERLIDELWGERPPATAAKVVQAYVSQLRRALGHDAIATRPPGYLLQVGDALDATRFRRLVDEARRLAISGKQAQAAALYREALALWRGPPLADVDVESFARNEIERLEEERLSTLMDRIECELTLGRHDQLIPELQTLTGQYPLRERLHAQLLLALYRAGRQADALAAYQHARTVLVEQLGLEPSLELQELERAILRHDPGLAAPTPSNTPRRHWNLPAQPTSFLGRHRELAEIVSLLTADHVRLLTLTGAGGSGKTRVALAAATTTAEDYPDGVCWVPLAALRDSALVLDSISQALGTKREPVDYLADKRLLLLLDNFEHLVEASAAIAGLLAACPRLNVLVTSREPLHVAGERQYRVPTLAEAEAAELFRERAHEDEPEQAVIDICRTLDCLPLAIELAAARTKLLPPDRLLQRLEKRLPLLTGGPRDAPERQRAMKATIAWSHELLTDEEKQLFARLAVFAGGCTLEAAEQVCDAGLDTLQSLVDKNLIGRDGERYLMLETIREYAAERLNDAEDSERAKRRHAKHFLGIAESTGYEGTYEGQLVLDSDNLRAALGWSFSVQDAELALRLATAFAPQFSVLNPAEGRRWLDDALALGEPSSLKLRAEALRRVGGLAMEAGDHQAATSYLKRSVADFNALGDRRSVAKALVDLGTATSAQVPGAWTEARALFEEALRIFERLSDAEGVGLALHELGELERQVGDRARARGLLERALSLRKDGRHKASIVHGLGDVALDEHDLERAESSYHKSLILLRFFKDERNVAYCLAGLSAVAAARGDLRRAGRLWGAVERIEASREATLPFERHRYERWLEAAREPVAPGDVLEGRAMTLDEAVAYALESNE